MFVKTGNAATDEVFQGRRMQDVRIVKSVSSYAEKAMVKFLSAHVGIEKDYLPLKKGERHQVEKELVNAMSNNI